MSEQTKDEKIINPEKAALNKNLERMAWGLFLVMLGGFMFIRQVPDGLWSIGVGLIMLGLNAARYLNGIKMSGFTTGVEGAFLLIILGAYLVLKPYFDKRGLFGKAEQS
jgi:hypothetical protein